jgi:hypothetical protein
MYQGTAPAVIAQSGTASTAIGVPQDMSIVGLSMPAGWDAASITFQVSADGTTWQTVKKVDGNNYTLTVAQATYVVIPPADLIGLPGVWQIRAVASAAQTTAARTLTFILAGSRA